MGCSCMTSTAVFHMIIQEVYSKLAYNNIETDCPIHLFLGQKLIDFNLLDSKLLSHGSDSVFIRTAMTVKPSVVKFDNFFCQISKS